MDDIDSLNVIHVAGTKGKGSTCALTESILRQFGLKTGFYSSPHLIHVRERIRINGIPLSENEFIKYFDDVYNRLASAVMQCGDAFKMPAYFKFLTVMAFYVFLQEKVDVAIMEVGIGGEHDCTNIVENPILCAVTTLDYDHMAMLGSTIKEIAWQKGGIFKKHSTAIVAEQEEEAMEVLRNRADERNCLFRLAPPFSAYDWPTNNNIEIGIGGVHQQHNVTVALQLAKLWLEKTNRQGKLN
ncbi:unnamed protein product [Gongylonema pulchrum]|uniref:Mur ligase central domain-containing protein n=1 Tax=Gongylonema pulchrum TaxID=637853 RepID=A0A3P7Q9G7_9BILA|nr:unnamed protein product [Gongylonema pulchrum]